ncbi:Uncharacterised protein [Halioglobus japonicus]|nr:Uncharacterised protein [Halioglobus japonicus]
MLNRLLAISLLLLLLASCAADTIKRADSPRNRQQVSREQVLAQQSIPVYRYKIIKAFPHNVSSYTEGLQLHDGYLYESTGRYNQSKLLKTDMQSGRIIQEHSLSPEYFGEGLAILGNRVFQLTYKSNIGFVYDSQSFKLEKTFSYPAQGWGLTTDGSELIMSDGSAALIFLNPDTLEQTRYITVSDSYGEVGFLNDLVYVDGEIFANVWQTDLIARISPQTGKVTAWIDLTGINPDPQTLIYPYVLNGVTYNSDTGNLIVAGKCWPLLFEIELVPEKNMAKSNQ